MSFSREAGRCGACGSTYPAGYWHFCPPAIATQEDLAAMQARAERAERERDDARASNALLLEALTERTQQRDEAEERVQRSCDHAHELLLRVEHAERLLAEAAPVVEAAELWAAEYAATGGDVSAVWATTHRKLAAAVAARSSKPVPDVHVAVSPEAVSDALRGVCGNQDRHSPRRCDRPAGHDGEHDQSNWPTGEMVPRSLRGAGEGGGA